MRWRVAGRNWEGREWWLSMALVTLLTQIDDAWPVGNPVLDGTVASKGHDAASPNSDHRPKPTTGRGVVRAADVWVPNRADGDLLCEQLRLSRDPRIAYVIFNGRRFQSTRRSDSVPAWAWHPYTGANPHRDHVHISVTSAADLLGAPWEIHLHPTTPEVPVIPDHLDVTTVTADHIFERGDRDGVDSTFEADVEWMLAQRIATEHTHPDGVVRSEELAAFLHRLDRQLIRPLAARLAVAEARIAHLENTGSGGGGSGGVSEERVRELIAGTRLQP